MRYKIYLDDERTQQMPKFNFLKHIKKKQTAELKVEPFTVKNED